MRKILFVAWMLSYFLPSATLATEQFGTGIVAEFNVISSNGRFVWAHDASSACDCLGDKTSELDWTSGRATALMLDLEAQLNSPLFLKFNIAGASVKEGEIIDDDYYSTEYAEEIGSPERFSRTSSKVLDGGFTTSELRLEYRHFFKHISLDYVGIYLSKTYWKEDFGAYGVFYIENPPINEQYLAVPYSVRSLSTETQVDPFGVGISTKFRLSRDVYLGAEYMKMINPTIVSEDTHHLRPDDFVKPLELKSSAEGHFAQLGIGYQYTDRIDLKLNYRQMRVSSDEGTITMYHPDETSEFPLLHQIIERSWISFGLLYKF